MDAINSWVLIVMRLLARLLNLTTIRTVLSLAVSRNWPIHQLDVKNAFLHGYLSETFYMHQPPGFVDPHHLEYVCHLQCSLYGLKFISSLHRELAMTDRGSLNCFLGVSAQRSATRVFLSHATYAEEHFERAHMQNADWASCLVTRRSTSGYCVFLGDNNVVAETAWIRNLLCKLHALIFIATLVYCDNASHVYLSNNPVQHHRTKHIELDIHYVRVYVAKGLVRVMHVPSRYHYADIFTNGLPSTLFQDFRSSLIVRRPPAPTARVY
ncbi:ribonuclease H-like domain-containing protein [Tanacetum coccineum]